MVVFAKNSFVFTKSGSMGLRRPQKFPTTSSPNSKVPNCPAFGWFEETEKSDPTRRPTEALTPPRRQDRRSERPEKSHKPSAWPAQDVDVPEKRPRGWQNLRRRVLPEVVSPHVFEELGGELGALEKKSLKKFDQQHLNHAGPKVPPGQEKTETENFGRTSSGVRPAVMWRKCCPAVVCP